MMTKDAVNVVTPRVSVVILNWNGREMLERFLPDVISNTPDDLARIIVADNGSSDGSVEMLAKRFPQVMTMAFNHNYGYAGGYNRAIDNISTPYAVLLNSDVAPQPGWLDPLVAYMDSDVLCAACQPKLLSVTDPGKFEYAGAAGGFLDRHGYPYCRGRIFDTIETDRGQYDDIVEVDWATGAALMVRVDCFRRVGGLDEEFFAHMEEIDLCWRMRRAGWRIAAVPTGVVRHLGGGSLPADNPRKTYLNFRNNLLMLRKNLAPRHRRRELFVRRRLDTLAWGRMVMTGHWRHASAILRAHRDYRRIVSGKDNSYGLLPPVAVNSSGNGHKITAADSDLNNNGSDSKINVWSEADNKNENITRDADTLHRRVNILVSYYIRRRRRFSDLS